VRSERDIMAVVPVAQRSRDAHRPSLRKLVVTSLQDARTPIIAVVSRRCQFQTVNSLHPEDAPATRRNRLADLRSPRGTLTNAHRIRSIAACTADSYQSACCGLHTSLANDFAAKVFA